MGSASAQMEQQDVSRLKWFMPLHYAAGLVASTQRLLGRECTSLAAQFHN